MNEKREKVKKPTGPEPERVKIPGDWEKAMSKAIKKPRPKEGWPDEKKPVDK